MPKIQKIFEVDVTPEKFLNACSREELIELELLLNSNYYKSRINNIEPERKYLQYKEK